MSLRNDPHDVMARHLLGSMVLLYKCHRIHAIQRYKRQSVLEEAPISVVIDAADFYLRERSTSRLAYNLTITTLSRILMNLNQSNRLFLFDAGIDFEKDLMAGGNVFSMEECLRQAELCVLRSPLSIQQPLFRVFPELEAAITLRSHPVPWITPLSDQQMRDANV